MVRPYAFNNWDEYSKSNMLQNHIQNAICSRSISAFLMSLCQLCFRKMKTNCKKTIWLSFYLKVNMSLFNDQLKFFTPLFSLCYNSCIILNIYFCSLLHDKYYVICYILKRGYDISRFFETKSFVISVWISWWQSS